MPFAPSLMLERLKSRNLDSVIPGDQITEIIFNKDEIIFKLIHSSKSEIPDLISFLIAAMGTSGLDENDMSKTEIVPTDKKTMEKTVTDFQNRWKLDLELKKYVKEEILYLYNATDTERTNYDSEISFIIETDSSYIYFFTHHFYY
ncbi:MAG: hypothetical protein LBE92_02930 [Chryseobacterium sp.]|jgi:hypothetical protein|uniref:hypothetical protein n=1 Tax=Chryseobacterium sp. TaxID=1871047 RepID=UPI00282569A5|nr:hypothetical protein [Chryseobacterium sp.]MDR2235053.1 hypothetical protein [Chryseobacterium sp.]